VILGQKNTPSPIEEEENSKKKKIKFRAGWRESKISFL
jgi:hypothetical protein